MSPFAYIRPQLGVILETFMEIIQSKLKYVTKQSTFQTQTFIKQISTVYKDVYFLF